MIPSSAIQVVENTHARVVVLEPPYYSFGALLLFFALGMLVLGTVLLSRRNMAIIVYTFFLTGTLLGLFGAYLATKKTTFTLSRDDGLLRVQTCAWGIRRSERVVSLDDIRRVTVETYKYTHVLTVVLNSGESFGVGDGSNRQGYYGAADIMNDFLGAPRQR
jgi:hypothetical protein